MISIIIPIYNSEKKLSECLDSIIKQSYQDFELILINDGSNDNSEEICHTYQSKHPQRIRYYHQVNCGVSSARNMGLDNANGEYICFVDSDDYVEPNYLVELLHLLEENNADISMCDICRKESDGSTIPLKDNNDIIYAIMSNTYGQTNRGPYCKLYKKSIIGSLRFNENIYLGEDTLFCVEYAKRCESGIYLQKGLYHYDIPTSSSAYRNDAKMLGKYLTYIDSRAEMLKDTTMLSQNTYALIVNSLYDSIQDSYYVAKKAGSYNTQKELCKTMRTMKGHYPISLKDQYKPVSWWIMAHGNPPLLDIWTFLYGKWHGLMKRIELK